MRLSILICSLQERRDTLTVLINELNRQANECPVQIITSVDNRERSVGLKRQILLEKATGDFVVYIDDDDEIDSRYVCLIDHVIKENLDIDCIGIQGWMTTNGKNKKNWKISKDYGSWYEKHGVYYRTPNHISPVRREIALKVGFKDKTFGEDYDYSMGILPYLKKEVKIEKDIYHYKFSTVK